MKKKKRQLEKQPFEPAEKKEQDAVETTDTVAEKREPSGSVNSQIDGDGQKNFTDTKGRRHERIGFKGLLTITVIGILLYWTLHHFPVIVDGISSIVSIFTPIIAGLAVAFIINAVLTPYERLWCIATGKGPKFLAKIKRPICLILSTITVIGAILAIIFMLIPELTSTFKVFADKLPGFFSKLEAWLEAQKPFLESIGIVLPESELSWQSFLKSDFNYEKFADSLVSFLTGQGFSSFLSEGKNVIDTTVDITTSIFSSVFNGVLAMVFAFYVLAQKEKVGRKVKSILYAFLPKGVADETVRISSLANSTFTKFVSGQLLEAVIIGVLCYIGMAILSIPYAAVVSVLVGATALIPIFGAFIGTAVGAVLILSVSFTKAIWFVVFIIVLQQIETNLIYPKVVGKSLGLPGILVFAAVTVGGEMFGFLGILLGVPVCSVLYSILNEIIAKRAAEKRQKSEEKAE